MGDDNLWLGCACFWHLPLVGVEREKDRLGGGNEKKTRDEKIDLGNGLCGDLQTKRRCVCGLQSGLHTILTILTRRGPTHRHAATIEEG